MSAPRSDALDWMKAAGITLIVYGHVAHATTVAWAPPIYVKQFGVAFFLFAAGVTLAREERPPIAALWVRLFPVYFFGLATALALSAIGLVAGTGPEASNYLPFMAGANVVFDSFPANPTSWYLGTYIHVLLLWACWLFRRRPGWSAVAAALAVEIPMRAALMQWAGPYVAYMFVTSWLGVFVAGLAVGRRPAAAPVPGGALLLILLIAGMAMAATVIGTAAPEPQFPFMTFGAPSFAGALVISALASAWYLPVTLLAFRAFSRWPAPAVVGWLARGALIIMLLHMPIFFAINPVLADMGWPYAVRVVVELAISLGVLGWVSATLTAAIQPKRLAGRLGAVVAAQMAGWRTPSLETR